MNITDFERSLLEMIEKFGPAISSATVEKRESALQSLVKHGCATITRNGAGQLRYAITREGSRFLES